MSTLTQDIRGTASAAKPWRRWGWLVVIALPIVGAGVGVTIYGQATDWYFLLPGLPPIERFHEEPERMNALADALRLPRPPDVRPWSFEEVFPVYEAYGRLRRDASDADAAGTLGLILEARGEAAKAVRAYRRAVEIHPGDTRWLHHLARVLEQTGEVAEARAILQETGPIPDGDELIEELAPYRPQDEARPSATSHEDRSKSTRRKERGWKSAPRLNG